MSHCGLAVFKPLFKHHRARLCRSSIVPFSLRHIVHFMFMEFQWKFNWFLFFFLLLLSRFGSSFLLSIEDGKGLLAGSSSHTFFFFPLSPSCKILDSCGFLTFFFIGRFITAVLINCQFLSSEFEGDKFQ